MNSHRQRLIIVGNSRSGKTAYCQMLNYCNGVNILDEAHLYDNLAEDLNVRELEKIEEELFDDQDYIIGDRYVYYREGNWLSFRSLVQKGIEFNALYVVRNPLSSIPVDANPTFERTVLNSWYKSVKNWIDIRDKIGSSTLTLRYEDLVENPYYVIKVLSNVYGIPLEELKIAYDHTFDTSKSSFVTSANIFNLGIKSLMAELNYG